MNLMGLFNAGTVTRALSIFSPINAAKKNTIPKVKVNTTTVTFSGIATSQAVCELSMLCYLYSHKRTLRQSFAPRNPIIHNVTTASYSQNPTPICRSPY